MDNTERTMQAQVYDTRSAEDIAATPMTEVEEIESLYCEMQEEQKYQQKAIDAFESIVNVYGYETAKRYQHQAYNTDGDEGALEYHMGLPYGYFKKRENTNSQ